MNSAIFLRTVKLKDFPWNGELALALAPPPAAAWNPIAGFTDPFGRLMWSAIGDPALLPSPYGSEWMFNRVSDVESVQPGKRSDAMTLRLLDWLPIAACGRDPVLHGPRRLDGAAEELTFDLKIEQGRVPPAMRIIRVKQGDVVKLRWTSDRLVALHLHGYDIERVVQPGAIAEMSFMRERYRGASP